MWDWDCAVRQGYLRRPCSVQLWGGNDGGFWGVCLLSTHLDAALPVAGVGQGRDPTSGHINTYHSVYVRMGVNDTHEEQKIVLLWFSVASPYATPLGNIIR